MRQVAISGRGGRLQAALLEGGRLREWRTDHEAAGVWAGDLYCGRVTDVLPGIQSAFVDIGEGQKAYLYVDDALPKDSSAGGKPTISQRVQVGETVIVQVSKEGTELKAPKVTARISLQGRYLVYLPKEEGVSLSRKIGDAAVRMHLQETLSASLKQGEGVIIRTEAAGAQASRLAEELAYLKNRWSQILASAQQLGKPGLVGRDAAMLEGVIRDLIGEGVDEVLVEESAAYQRTKAVMQVFAPEQLDRLVGYRERQPLFARLGVDAQLKQAMQRTVPLKSGGHLVIDRTEAMTVIDVNTGAFTGKGGQQREQAVTMANLEAAAEIAVQLRLRDIGGIIVIDFIDMQEAANKERVLTALKRELSRDPVPATVLGMTALGLVEMTRKRVRASLAERMTEPCNACRGQGRVWTIEEMLRRLSDELTALARVQEAEAVVLELPERLHQALDGMDEEERRRWPVEWFLLPSPEIKPDEYRILYAGRYEEAARLAKKQSQMT